MIRFFDTSALGAAYLGEPGRLWVRELLFWNTDRAMVSELADVELPGLLCRSQRNGVITDEELQALLGIYDMDTCSEGPIGVLRLTPTTLTTARQIALDEPVGSLDAIHLAAAVLLQQKRPQEAVTVVTLDRRQATAARRLGFHVLGDLEDPDGPA